MKKIVRRSFPSISQPWAMASIATASIAMALMAAAAVAQPLSKPAVASFVEGRIPEGSVIKQAILELADGSTEVVSYAATPDGKAVIDGDILITVDGAGRARIAKDLDRLWAERNTFSKSTGRNGSSFRWQNNTVPFLIEVADAFQQQWIEDAIEHIENLTAVRFVPRTNQADFVAFVNTPGVCRSFVGRQGGRQEIELDRFGCGFGQIAHEVGHALGLWHEHQRTDRDASVIVNWANIEPGAENNFQIRSGFLRGPFDFNSIMNYGSFFFADNPAVPTLTRLDGTTWVANRAALTAGDASGIGDMYKRVRASISFQCIGFLNSCDFSGLSQFGVQPTTSWQWTIEDGNSVATPTGSLVSYQFQTAGPHYVFLEVTDSQGDRASALTVVDLSECEGFIC